MSRQLAESLRPYIIEMVNNALGAQGVSPGTETPWEISSGIALVDNKTGTTHRVFIYDGILYIENRDMNSPVVTPLLPVKPPDNGINPPVSTVKVVDDIQPLPGTS